MSFDLRQLRAFEAVAKHGGFSKASEEVGLTQPTLSTHIQNLENSLGVRLFDRASRSVSLTPTGALLADYASRILELCEESIQAVQVFTGQMKGSVMILASTVPGEYILPKWLVDFNRRYPEVRVTLTVHDSGEVISRVERGETAVGVTGTPGNHPLIESTLLCEDRIVLVESALDKPEDDTSVREQAHLADLTLIRREPGSGTQLAVEKALTELGLIPGSLNWKATLGSTRAVIEGVVAGLGAAFISYSAVAREIESGRLLQIPILGMDIRRGLYVVRNKHKTLSPVASCFMEELLRAGPLLGTPEK